VKLAPLSFGFPARSHRGCKLQSFLPSSISAVKLSPWARKHGMGYLTAWQSACGRLYGKRSPRHRAKRILEAMCG
jgi:hypothetical protein